MSKTDTRVLTAHVPVPLADQVDRLTREAMADVTASRVTDHQAVQAWAESLDSDNPLPAPR